MKSCLFIAFALIPLLICTAIAAGQGSSFIDTLTGMEFIAVPGGCFQMGDTIGDGEDDEDPVHEVCVDSFSMGKYSVTVEAFRKFVDATGYVTDAEKQGGCFTFTADGKFKKLPSSNWKAPGFAQAEKHPVVCVSWNDADQFRKWLAQEGRSYRLPTEAEWEYAARAGTKGRNYWGDNHDDACRYANVNDLSFARTGIFSLTTHVCDDGYAFTAPVGSFQPNGFGLYDMMGNAWQWTGDWYSASYYEHSPRNNPQGPSSGQKRVPRGGSWRSSVENMRASLRAHPPSLSAGVGFRLVSPIK